MRASFTYGNGTVTARKALVRDELAIPPLINQLASPDEGVDDGYARAIYARFLQLATIEGDIGFPVPAVNASRKVKREGFEAFLEQDGTFISEWQTALNETYLPPDAEKNEVGAASEDEPNS